MTDFAALLRPDRGEPAHLDPPRRQGEPCRLAQAPARAAPDAARRAALRGQAQPVRDPARRQGFRGRRRGRQPRHAHAMVPGAARRDASRRHLPPRRCRARRRCARLAARPAPLRPLPLQARRGRGPAHPAHRRCRDASTASLPKRARRRWSATSSTRPPPTLARPSIEAAVRALGDEAKARVEVTPWRQARPRLPDDRRGRPRPRPASAARG